MRFKKMEYLQISFTSTSSPGRWRRTLVRSWENWEIFTALGTFRNTFLQSNRCWQEVCWEFGGDNVISMCDVGEGGGGVL